MNYTEVEQCIAKCEPFIHDHSMRGELRGGGSYDQYVIFSYATEIARCSVRNGYLFSKEVTNKKYSTTTSRQCNIIKRAWGLA